VMGRSMY